MKTKLILTSIAVSVALLSSAFAANGGRKGNGAPGACPYGGPENCPNYQTGACLDPEAGGGACYRGNNPNRTPKRDGTGGPQQNPNRQPKRDGTGGPGKPANPAGPQDGTGPGPRR